mgnify:CR=1 FL=1
MEWMETLLTVVFLSVLAYVGVSMLGAARWAFLTRALQSRLVAGRQTVLPARFELRELSGLPDPVQRYFRVALTAGQPMLGAVRIEHAGSFNIADSGADRWKAFTSGERVIARPPGFVWDGRVTLIPGLTVHVHDAYVAGEGTLHPALFGLTSLARRQGKGDVARDELMRFLAEAACYPTALLPSQGVQWQAVDQHSATATLKDGEVSASLLFGFNEDGLIESVRAEARGRTLNGKLVVAPWEGLWSDYQQREGMTIPMCGEARWLMSGGPRPYWRARIGRIDYEFV